MNLGDRVFRAVAGTLAATATAFIVEFIGERLRAHSIDAESVLTALRRHEIGTVQLS